MWIHQFIGMVCLSSAMVFGRNEDAALPSSGDRRAAEVYFGTYRRNEPLADRPDQWPFVRQHADGFLMHFGFWLNNDYQADPDATARKLGPILRDAGLKTMLEIGFPSRNAPQEFAIDMGHRYGERYAEKITRFERGTGMRVDEIECELRPARLHHTGRRRK